MQELLQHVNGIEELEEKDIFHLFAYLYSADGVCKGHVRGQLRRENLDELQKASNNFFFSANTLDRVLLFFFLENF